MQTESVNVQLVNKIVCSVCVCSNTSNVQTLNVFEKSEFYANIFKKLVLELCDFNTNVQIFIEFFFHMIFVLHPDFQVIILQNLYARISPGFVKKLPASVRRKGQRMLNLHQ